MGFFDFVVVCPKCRDGVVAVKNCCPTCGTQTMKFIAGSSNESGMFNQSEWKKKSFAEQKALIREVLSALDLEKFVTTAFSFENYEIESYYGPVAGADIYVTNGPMAGNIVTQDSSFDTAFKKAKANMISKAQTLGANAIIGMQVNLSAPGAANSMVVAVVGTAVKIKEK